MPWLSSSSALHLVLAFVFDVNTSCLVQQGYKATFLLAARVPLCGLEYSMLGRKMPAHASSKHGGVLTHYSPLYSHANCDPVLLVVVLVMGFTI